MAVDFNLYCDRSNPIWTILLFCFSKGERMNNLSLGKKILLSLGLLIVTSLALLLFINIYVSSKYQSAFPVQLTEGASKIFTREELKKFDGTDSSLPIYLALDGLVYNVTVGREFYGPGGHYHYLAGKDYSWLLHIVGGDTIKKKYPVVGKLSG